MVTPQIQAEGVKAALSSSTAASASTVTTLQSLLSDPIAAKSTQDEAQQTTGRPSKTAGIVAKGRNVKTKIGAKARGKSAKERVADVHEDEARILSAKEKYGLATDVVNISLKTLTDALKPQPKAHRRVSSARNSAPPSPKHARTSSSPASLRTLTRTPSQRALQLRTANDTSAPPSPVKKPSKLWRTSSTVSAIGKLGPASGIVAVAECARLGFAHLRIAQIEKLHVREMPSLQLETGMLALVGKLIAHGLESLAVKELRTLKRRLEAHVNLKSGTQKAVTPAQAPDSDRETIATLLHFNTVDVDSPALSLVLAHQMHTVKVIAALRRAAITEAAVQFLVLQTACSPANLFVQQAKVSGDSAKGVKQLETLAQTILSLCPGPSSTADEEATDYHRSPSPEATFQLQALALRIRQQWWKMASHQANHLQDLYEPFARCLVAFARRSTQDPESQYELAKALYAATLDSSAIAEPGFKISRTLSSMAQAAGLQQNAQIWANAMASCLDGSEAGNVIVVLRMASAALSDVKGQVEAPDPPRLRRAEEHLFTAIAALKGGMPPDQPIADALFAELSGLRRVIGKVLAASVEDTAHCCLRGTCHEVMYEAVRFVQRYMDQIPRKRLVPLAKLALPIVDTCLYCCKSSVLDGSADWATLDEALQSCLVIELKLPSSSDLCRSVRVRVSNIYWLHQKSLKDGEGGGHVESCLSRSVAALENASEVEQVAGLYAAKLEKYGSTLPPVQSINVFRESVSVHIRAGTLGEAGKAAASLPLKIAWASSDATASMYRVLRLLNHSCMKAPEAYTEGQDGLYDGHALPVEERGVLLECYLNLLTEYVDKPKYRDCALTTLAHLLETLLRVYAPEIHPIRRARVATIALRLHDSHGGIVCDESLRAIAGSPIVEHRLLDKDLGLSALYESTRAALDLARLFHNEARPKSDGMRQSLHAWQTVIDSSEDLSSLSRCVEDLAALGSQLESIAVYLAMQGDDQTRLPVLQMLTRLYEHRKDTANTCQSLAELGLQYVRLYSSEKAGRVFARMPKPGSDTDVPGRVRCRCALAYAEYLLAVNNQEKCKVALADAQDLLPKDEPDLTSQERIDLFKLHADAAVLQSKLLLAIGSSDLALAEAKRAVQLMNGLWSSLERRKLVEMVPETVKSGDALVDPVAEKVSKLTLALNNGREQRRETTRSGAAYWKLLPALSGGLLQLSDMYSFYGLFVEANTYSDQALRVVESVGSNLTFHVRSHRTQLLVSASRVEDAELCLANDSNHIATAPSIFQVERCLATASLRMREKSWSKASMDLREAETIMERTTSSYLESWESLAPNCEDLVQRIATLSVGSPAATSKAKAVPRPRNATAPSAIIVKPKGRQAARQQPLAPRSSAKAAETKLLSKLYNRILLQQTLVLLHIGKIPDASAVLARTTAVTGSEVMLQKSATFNVLMLKAAKAIHSDFTFSILPESTLSFPALARRGKRPSEPGAPRSSLLSPPQKGMTRATSPIRSAKVRRAPKEDIGTLLRDARDCIAEVVSLSVLAGSTSFLHHTYTLSANVAMLMSATAAAQTKGLLHPVRVALSLDLPRIHALKCEVKSSNLDRKATYQEGFLKWRQTTESGCDLPISAAQFQSDYIDIIPRQWNVVSMSISERGDELFVTRYRGGQAPFILRLPIARRKDDDPDEQAFDFTKARAELEDIIHLSNYSCHSSNGGASKKGGKSGWWSEREALDRRLHELLINIENIWLGGFKGIFSQSPRQPELLARFRKSFELILSRYLPSRKLAKSADSNLTLDHRVLELFVGLGDDQDGIIDLDEPLADLLYFVVDILQSNGERNAYDEIDFDSMTVEVLDALRSYYEAASAGADEDHHMILILDKRLHAFPWESLPCLDGSSVSRLGSMLALRERIIAMQPRYGRHDACSDRGSVSQNDDARYTVPRNSGTYILNPSSDLANTQTTLAPHLAALHRSESSEADASWTSIIGRAPAENEFTSALSRSSTLLYFGHGAGSQYMRTRSVKKLKRCSEVVWLMGCSSGAVTEYGDLEPQSVPLAYLLAGDDAESQVSENNLSLETSINAGDQQESSDQRRYDRNGLCAAVVATLWDVTDKDIDRLSVRLGEEWGLWPSACSGSSSATVHKMSGRCGRVVTPTTPQQSQKTPKTPKTKASKAARTPARSQSRATINHERKRSLVEALTKSRDACYLRYLNGAAAVVYGVPVYLGD